MKAKETTNMTDNRDQYLLTLNEAAARLGISRAGMYRLLNAGRIKTVHVGRSHRVSNATLNEFIASLSSGG
jgi:excisionase family DNA binding protein